MSVKRRRLSAAGPSSGAVRRERLSPSRLPLAALEELALFEPLKEIAGPVEQVDCRSVIDAVCSAHGKGAMEHCGSFRSSLTIADLVVQTNGRVLRRIVEHLATHVLYGHPSVRIAGVRRSGKGREFVDIYVSDRGPGLPVNTQALVAPRAWPSSVRLRVCRRLAKLIHARITQRVDHEQGCTFTLSLQAFSKNGKPTDGTKTS